MHQPHRSGFTLIELLVVITIISILTALVITGIAKLRDNAKAHATEQTIRAIGSALEIYLADWPRLGDGSDEDSADFSDQPAVYLDQRMEDAGKVPLLEMRSPAQVDGVFYDNYGSPLEWTIVNGPADPFPLTQSIEIRSTRGTPAADDDLVYTIDIANQGSWQWENR